MPYSDRMLKQEISTRPWIRVGREWWRRVSRVGEVAGGVLGG